MATIPRPSEGNYEKRDPIPAGTHVARCVQLIEIGTVEDQFKNEVKKAFKVSIGFELPNVLGDFEENGQVVKKPLMTSKMFTLSAHEKSSLRNFIESWRGAPYKQGEFEKFDISRLLGHACLVNIIHEVKGENTYAKLSAIMPVMQGLTVPPQFNPSKYLAYDNFDVALFQSLPKFLREKIESTPEYRALNNGFNQAAPAPQQFPAAPQPTAQAPQHNGFAQGGFAPAPQVAQAPAPVNAPQPIGPADDLPF